MTHTFLGPEVSPRGSERGKQQLSSRKLPQSLSSHGIPSSGFLTASL